MQVIFNVLTVANSLIIGFGLYLMYVDKDELDIEEIAYNKWLDTKPKRGQRVTAKKATPAKKPAKSKVQPKTVKHSKTPQKSKVSSKSKKSSR